MSDKTKPFLWILATLTALNAAAMVVVPETWYAATPGVSHTGPFNPHFVRDIGFTFAAMTAAYVIAATHRPQRRAVLIVAATWMGLHGGLHMIETLAHPWETGPRLLEIAFVILPGLVTILLALNAPKAAEA